MALSDTKKWRELEIKCHEINTAIREMKQFAEENNLVLIDRGGVDSIWLRAFGKGLRDSYRENSVTEVWQDSTGCSEQGTSMLQDMLYGDEKILVKPKDEVVTTKVWDESAAHWADN